MVRFRPFQRRDLDQLALVYEKAFAVIYGMSAPEHAEKFIKLYHAALIRGIEGEMYIAEEAGNVLGFAVIHEESREEYKFGPIVVLPSVQRQGIGSQLLKLCIEFTRSKNVNQFYLKVNENNQTAINFYKKHRFTIVDRLPSDLEGIKYVKMVILLSR